MPPTKGDDKEKAVQGSSRLTARDQILHFMQGRLDVVSTAKIACEIQANLPAIYMALGKLVEDKLIVRVRTGMYANPGVVTTLPPKPPPRPPTDGPAWMNLPSENEFNAMTAAQADKALRDKAKSAKAVPPMVNVEGPPITDLVTPVFTAMQAKEDTKHDEMKHILLAPPDQPGGPMREIRVKDEAEAEQLREAASVELRFREAQVPRAGRTEVDDDVWARYEQVMSSAAIGPASAAPEFTLGPETMVKESVFLKEPEGSRRFQQSMDAVVQQLDDLAADAEPEEDDGLVWVYRSDGSLQLTVGGYDIEIPPEPLLKLARFLARLV